MIAYLQGTTIEKQDRWIILMTAGGVGYKVWLTPEGFAKIKVQEKTSLFIHSHVKEDAFDLYGFETKSQLNLFELLISVSGVGPKTALNVMSSGSVEEISSAIAQSDTGFFTSTPGIGTKGAQRIIVDLRNKVGALGDLDLSDDKNMENKQISEALKGFGFKESEAREAIKTLPKDGSLTLEQKIKLALKSLSR